MGTTQESIDDNRLSFNKRSRQEMGEIHVLRLAKREFIARKRRNFWAFLGSGETLDAVGHHLIRWETGLDSGFIYMLIKNPLESRMERRVRTFRLKVGSLMRQMADS